MAEIAHTPQFRFRRFINWFSIGLAYAFLYMGRYNLTVTKNALGDLMTKAEFGNIFGVGALVYGLAFVINGPLTDRYGGRRMMLIATLGAVVANSAMGVVLYGIGTRGWELPIYQTFVLLYAINMYFQSFGALSIVTVKAPWFHVRERGTFSTIFGVMISLGIYFAFDWGYAIMEATRGTLGDDLRPLSVLVTKVFGTGGTGVDENWWLFFIPAMFLSLMWFIMLAVLRNSPAEAGYANFDTGEESVTDVGERVATHEVFRRILTHPVLLVVCGIEFCSGVLRQGVMHWYPIFAKETGFYADFFVTQHWGLMLLIAGVTGGILTGWASDRFFNSRRAPMSAVLYALMLVATFWMSRTLEANLWHVGSMVLIISMAVIGVHGIMSGTATMDFGGAKNAGTATGIVDGVVYLGTAFQSFVIGHITPTGEAKSDPGAWSAWPLFLLPLAALGLVLALRIWNARPKPRE
ncbi:MAG: MFS transporter [Candidatus Latescibacterota bacterium]|nr:MAG: MFS transporter [Candidatus Latescibacterota bacterium]